MTDATSVLRLLAKRRNVLLSGAPGTGKSRLLSAVEALFRAGPPLLGRAAPALNVAGNIPIQAAPAQAANDPLRDMRVPNREVFRAVMHQSSKQRDFLTGIMPDLRLPDTGGPAKEASAMRFRIVEGVLYRAAEYAKRPDHAALLIIDEINRGPAVQVFGGAIVAMEGEKRLQNDGTKHRGTQVFDLLDPSTGSMVEYAFPARLYILAAMNQADVSVEPLDVAFLRRWAPIRLEPSSAALREFFGIANPTPLPENATEAAHIYEAAVRAFEAINARIVLGRGPEFQIGHGVLMDPSGPAPADLEGAKALLATGWSQVRNHVEEAFFGDTRGTAIVLNAVDAVPGHPLALREASFGETPRVILDGPRSTEPDGVYAMLKAVAAMPTPKA